MAAEVAAIAFVFAAAAAAVMAEVEVGYCVDVVQAVEHFRLWEEAGAVVVGAAAAPWC